MQKYVLGVMLLTVIIWYSVEIYRAIIKNGWIYKILHNVEE
jgi:hypothetical protein